MVMHITYHNYIHLYQYRNGLNNKTRFSKAGIIRCLGLLPIYNKNIHTHKNTYNLQLNIQMSVNKVLQGKHHKLLGIAVAIATHLIQQYMHNQMVEIGSGFDGQYQEDLMG